MHFYNFNVADFNNSTRHLTLVERALYRDLIDMYYHNEQPIDGSDMDKLARRLICQSESDRQALEYVLDEFFIKRGKRYHHHRIDKELKNYRYKNRNADVTQPEPPRTHGVTSAVTPSNALCNVSRNAPCNAYDDFETPMTPAERAHKSRLKKKGLIDDLANAGVDTKDLNDKTPMAELEALHKEYVTSVTQTVTPSNDNCNASNAKNAAITSNHKPATNNQLNTLNNNSAGETDVTNGFDVEVWQPLLADIQPLVTEEAPAMSPMTQVQFDKHLTKFRNLRIEQAAKGNPVITEARCLDMFVDWIKREYIYEQKSKVTTVNAATGERTPPADYSKIGRAPVTNDSDLPSVFHPSHSKPVSNSRVNPNQALVFNGLLKPALPGMTLEETDAYVRHEARLHGETTDITYDRLLNELQEAV
ncbi:MAG: YdaU family protein [Psychrobacter sp.]|nr:YdaU family protein [Psychrobacter sp.]